MPNHQQPSNTAVGTSKSGPGRPRSRTGCLTCRKRRVKCDETKPTCHRCSKFGRRCGGYVDEVFSIPHRLHEPASLRFRNDHEQRYFIMFSEMVAPCLSIYFNSRLWDRLLLQACESHYPTRYAAIAIGALRKIEGFRGLPDAHSLQVLEDARAHYKYALRQYALAVKLMQRDSVNSIYDLRLVLVNCMVIVCFETLHGNYDAALRQTIVGLGLLLGYAEKENPLYQPNPDIEEELIRVFGRLSHGNANSRPLLPSNSCTCSKDSAQACFGLAASNTRTVDQARMDLRRATQQRIEYMISIAPFHSMSCIEFDISQGIPKGQTPKDITSESTPNLESINDAMALEFLCRDNRFVQAQITSADRARFMPLFAQIIWSARETLRNSRSFPQSGPLSLETQVFLPLRTVMHHCPDPILQEEARKLSLLCKQREDFVDTFQAGALAEWVRLMAVAKWVKQYTTSPTAHK